MEQKAVTMAKCGMDCTACRFSLENDCPGCPYTFPPESRERLFEDEECEVGICCEAKGFDTCARCTDFPCDALKAVSFDTETGDGGGRLMTLKALKDSEYRIKRRKLTAPAAGGCLGLIAGIIIGCITGNIPAYIAAGIIAGTGLGYIIGIAKGDRRN
ncbi:MAG: DUF3795 domain-containing protein [Oscillospiraceae bacterium]|nr:DUF3795 domain-containing protein [Oscillospiraceae bacterium]